VGKIWCTHQFCKYQDIFPVKFFFHGNFRQTYICSLKEMRVIRLFFSGKITLMFSMQLPLNSREYFTPLEKQDCCKYPVNWKI
jgi:hypothetical protein